MATQTTDAAPPAQSRGQGRAPGACTRMEAWSSAASPCPIPPSPAPPRVRPSSTPSARRRRKPTAIFWPCAPTTPNRTTSWPSACCARCSTSRWPRTRSSGVRVHRVTPPAVQPSNQNRALICLHGGGFAWGAVADLRPWSRPSRSPARWASEVVAVDYRLGPEHGYPAASEDVAAVYRALLQDRAPEAIGVYGCSAGAVLTAQSVAWIAKEGLPRPGAIAMLGAGRGRNPGRLHLSGPAARGLWAIRPASRCAWPVFAYFSGHGAWRGPLRLPRPPPRRPQPIPRPPC